MPNYLKLFTYVGELEVGLMLYLWDTQGRTEKDQLERIGNKTKGIGVEKGRTGSVQVYFP